jgi:hypothetical protein
MRSFITFQANLFFHLVELPEVGISESLPRQDAIVGVVPAPVNTASLEGVQARSDFDGYNFGILTSVGT